MNFWTWNQDSKKKIFEKKWEISRNLMKKGLKRKRFTNLGGLFVYAKGSETGELRKLIQALAMLNKDPRQIIFWMHIEKRNCGKISLSFLGQPSLLDRRRLA